MADLLASIGDQRVDEFEVVVVDADSDDGTIEAVQAAAQRLDVPVRLEVADRHLSIGEARNRAVGLAQAPVVAFVSADVELDERFTERALASIEEADMVFSRQVHDPRSWSLGAAVRGLRYHHFPTEPTDAPLRYASHVAAVYRREIPERFPFDPDVVAVDDLLLADRARRAGYEPAYDPDMVVYHHDVADAEGELAKSVREARGWGLYVDELGPMTPVIAWGLALVAAIGLLFAPGSLVPTSTGVELAVLAGVLWAPTLRRVARQAGAMPAGPLAFATVASPVFDLVFLFNYARGLLEAKGSPTASTPEGIEP